MVLCHGNSTFNDTFLDYKYMGKPEEDMDFIDAPLSKLGEK